eukprot:sb/3475983/
MPPTSSGYVCLCVCACACVCVCVCCQGEDLFVAPEYIESIAVGRAHHLVVMCARSFVRVPIGTFLFRIDTLRFPHKPRSVFTFAQSIVYGVLAAVTPLPRNQPLYTNFIPKQVNNQSKLVK